jgi:hypothetical protein
MDFQKDGGGGRRERKMGSAVNEACGGSEVPLRAS